MTGLAYSAAASLDAASAYLAEGRGVEIIAGGTDMLQLLEERVRSPRELLDINGLPLAGVTEEGEGLRIGALTRLVDIADDPRVRERFPAVAEALLASASPQVRNMATAGGNLLQRTRCLYFRDVATPCNKREPGSGCPAQDGQNRINAILGGSPHCIATYPGDFAVALLALDAEVRVRGPKGERAVPIGEFHREPGDTPQIETVLEPGDIITAIAIPASPFARRSHYFKVRDRASFEWAIASAAVALELDGGTVRQARVAAGGVATKPWRLPQVERALVGQRLEPGLINRACVHATDGAELRTHNAFKAPLLQRTLERALLQVGGVA